MRHTLHPDVAFIRFYGGPHNGCLIGVDEPRLYVMISERVYVNKPGRYHFDIAYLNEYFDVKGITWSFDDERDDRAASSHASL